MIKKYNDVIRKYDETRNPEYEKILVEQNTFPWKAKIGMILSSYSDHLPFLKYTLNNYRKVKDMYIIGAFDNRKVTQDYLFPTSEILELSHSWVFKHHTFGGHAKRHGWIWSQIYSTSILKTFDNIEHVVLANGDCCWDKPNGIYEIIDLLGDNDFISGQSYTREHDGFNFIHTCTMVFKRDSYFNFIDFVIEKMKKEDSTVSFSPEGLINQWSKNVKFIHAPIQPMYPDGTHDFYCETNSNSTWKNILGFRNLEAENRYRRYEDKSPLPKKYFDLTHMSWYKDIDRNCLLKYFNTNDETYLKKWWKYKKY